MSSRLVKQVFEKYQKERSAFVQKVADLASHSENIETLQNVGRIFKINVAKQTAKLTIFSADLQPKYTVVLASFSACIIYIVFLHAHAHAHVYSFN